jgi:hypothetical protein
MSIAAIEQSYADYTYAYEQGQISRDEYKSLLEGLEIEQAVTMNAEELQRKEQLNQIINAAITVVSAVA